MISHDDKKLLNDSVHTALKMGMLVLDIQDALGMGIPVDNLVIQLKDELSRAHLLVRDMQDTFVQPSPATFTISDAEPRAIKLWPAPIVAHGLIEPKG